MEKYTMPALHSSHLDSCLRMCSFLLRLVELLTHVRIRLL